MSHPQSTSTPPTETSTPTAEGQPRPAAPGPDLGVRTVLLVDDDPDLRDLIELGLRKRGFAILSAPTAAAAAQMVRKHDISAVVADVQLETPTAGLELCTRLAETHPNLPVIVMTAHGNMNVAIKAIRAGAYDFITKPITIDGLEIALNRALRHHTLQREVAELRRQSRAMTGERRMLGESPLIRKVRDQVREVAKTDATILVVGESGTGKELVARALHEHSDRHEGPFVAINCAAMPASLLESELFGHVRGAFTDAKSDREGLFVRASKGTIFLDEIAEMPTDMQVKLLRVLQERKVRPVGGDREIDFDVRIVAATNRDLEKEVAAGRFRQDLFYRIDVVRITVPPLRERGRDIILLANYWIDQAAERAGKKAPTLGPLAARKLLAYDWPGNVRELQNSMERAVALTKGDEVTVESLPSTIREHQSEAVVETLDDIEDVPTLAEVEKRHIARVLRMTEGNKTRAAEVLGLDRRTLYRRLAKHNIKI